MVKGTFSLSFFAACFLFISPTIATSRSSGKLKLNEITERPHLTPRSRSHTSPHLLLSSSSKNSVLEEKGEQVLSFSLPPISSLPASHSDWLKRRKAAAEGTIAKKEDAPIKEAVSIQTLQKDFPPKTLSSAQLQSIILAKIRHDEDKAAGSTDSETGFAELDETTLASVKATPKQYEGLLSVLKSLTKSDEKRDDKNVFVNPYITAKRADPIGLNNDTKVMMAETTKGNNVRSVLYSYKLMCKNIELKIPFDDEGVTKFLDGKINFSFIERMVNERPE